MFLTANVNKLFDNFNKSTATLEFNIDELKNWMKEYPSLRMGHNASYEHFYDARNIKNGVRRREERFREVSFELGVFLFNNFSDQFCWPIFQKADQCMAHFPFKFSTCNGSHLKRDCRPEEDENICCKSLKSFSQKFCINPQTNIKITISIITNICSIKDTITLTYRYQQLTFQTYQLIINLLICKKLNGYTRQFYKVIKKLFNCSPARNSPKSK